MPQNGILIKPMSGGKDRVEVSRFLSFVLRHYATQ